MVLRLLRRLMTDRNVLLLLSRAVRPFTQRHLRIAEIILPRNILDVNALGNYRTPLDCAAGGGNLDLAKLLLDHGADVEIPEVCYPISTAAGNGHIDVVQHLLEHGAGSSLGFSAALWSAALAGYVDIIQTLIDHGAVVDYGTHYSPLHGAAYNGHIPALEIPINSIHNAEADVADKETALHHAVNGQTVDFLLSRGYNIEARDTQGQTPLFLNNNLHSPGRKDLDIGVIRALLTAGANVNAQDHDGRTCLFAPVYEVQDQYNLNWDDSAATNIRKYYGENPRMLRQVKVRNRGSYADKPLEIVKLLLAAGIDTNIHGQDGRTVCHCILDRYHGPAYSWGMPSHGGLELFRLLIEAGADISMRDGIGITPLHQAARAGDCPILDMLMQHGADVNAQTKNGRTPLIEAVAVDSDRKPHLLVTRMLLEHGADVRLTSSYGRTILHEIASMPQKRLDELDFNVVSLLLDNGADPMARDHNGQSASDLAARESNAKLVEALEKWGME